MFGTCVVALGISDGLFEGLALIEGATDFVGTSDGDFEVVGLKTEVGTDEGLFEGMVVGINEGIFEGFALFEGVTDFVGI